MTGVVTNAASFVLRLCASFRRCMQCQDFGAGSELAEHQLHRTKTNNNSTLLHQSLRARYNHFQIGQLASAYPPSSTSCFRYLQPYSMSSPRFFSQPIRYLRWASFEKPAIFYSIVVGSLGPVIMVVVPPIRRRLGDGPRPPIPLTYPSQSTLQEE